MAKLERQIKGDFSKILNIIEEGILRSSLSSSLEDSSDFVSGDARCSVRVFERYSVTGQNRLSLSVTLFQNRNDDIYITGISSGGSQGLFLKINRLGENAFLDVLEEVLDNL